MTDFNDLIRSEVNNIIRKVMIENQSILLGVQKEIVKLQGDIRQLYSDTEDLHDRTTELESGIDDKADQSFVENRMGDYEESVDGLKEEDYETQKVIIEKLDKILKQTKV